MKTQINFLSLALALSLFGIGSSFASTFTITCGKNAYEALDTNGTLDQAEFSAVITMKGKNNPPVLTRLTDDGADILANSASTKIEAGEGSTDITIEMRGEDRYLITNLTGCNDLDESTGDVQFMKHIPRGFSGYRAGAKAKCNCVKK